MKVRNFSAGPAILPSDVLKEASKAVKNFNETGLSILEMSHRGPDVTAVFEEATARVQQLLNLNDDYAVLWLTGGASSQFYMTAMNLVANDEKLGYINTGTWSDKAIKEAKIFADVVETASSKEKGFNYIPKRYKVDPALKYLHYTSNNTIFGTQYAKAPDVDMPLICDMSSDIFSRPIDVEKYGLIYAGAQKNMGPAGVTLVVVRKDILGKIQRTIPTMLDYQTHVAKGSMFNTPPVYPVYVSMLTLRWIEEKGGLEAMEKLNKSKARLLYREIDNNPLFQGYAAKPDRSLMNVTFNMAEGHEDKAEAFIAAATAAGCMSIKGHRSVGGFRASIYNAMPRAGVKQLVDVMRAFG